MPTLGNIQKQIAMYLKKSLVDFDVSGDAGQNLVLTALNNARKHAERLHDFSVCRQRGYFSFTEKTAWDSPTWYDGETGKLRKGKLWDLRTEGAITSEFGGTNIPLKMIRGDTKHQLESRRAYDAAVSDFERRALPDSTLLFDHPLLNQVYIMTRGKWLEYYPHSADVKNIMVDGYRWWPDWPLLIEPTPTITIETSNLTSEGVTATPPDLGIVMIPNAALILTGRRRLDVSAIPIGADASVTYSFEYNGGYPVYEQPGTITHQLTTGVTLWDAQGEIMSILNAAGFACTITGSDLYISRLIPTGSLSYSIYTLSITSSPIPFISDWWTENASEYLLWRALVECNHLGHVFTANREANLPSPDKKAETALALLIQNDQDAENPGTIQQY